MIIRFSAGQTAVRGRKVQSAEWHNSGATNEPKEERYRAYHALVGLQELERVGGAIVEVRTRSFAERGTTSGIHVA